MNDPVFVTALAVLLAVLAAWGWVRRRSLLRWAKGLRKRRPAAPAPEVPLPGSCRWEPIDRWLFVLSLLVYGGTRLIGIERFPIYFFTDEAANAVLAAEFLDNGLRDAAGKWFPIYFANSEKLSLSLSVYLQVLPTLLFGTSVFTTRAVSALVGLSGAAAVGLILKDAFGLRAAWVGVMLMAITPTWFLHSRTAFETTLYASLFAWFLYFYLRYRAGRTRALFPAIAFGALAFYAYNAGQPGLVVCGALLIAVDARYHLENRKSAVLAAALVFLLALPYLRFQARHPGESLRRLELLDSYLVRTDLSPLDKAGRFVETYAAGLSPAYWYSPDNGRDLIRHRMKGYGNLLWPLLPLAVIGLVIGLRRWRDPAHRTMLIALFTAPIGAAMAGLAVTRSLVFVVPATILTAVGAAAVIRRFDGRAPYARLAVACFVLLSLVSLGMVWDALANGPTWYADYGLTGMQYGARQVFSATSDYLARHPDTQAWIFPAAWNGSDMLRRFFAPHDERISLLNLDSFLEERHASLESALVVLTAADYARVLESGKFTVESRGQTLPLPDGSPGFHLVRLGYSASADELFAAELEARRAMVEDEVEWNDRTVVVRHTPFDYGSAQNLFDGDPSTFVRTAGINPAILELEFGEPIRLTRLRLIAGHSNLAISVRVDPGGGVQPGQYEHSFTGLPPDPSIELVLDPPPGPMRRLAIEVHDLQGPATSHVHLRELDFLE